jgi:tetratricopeptide (TPR) repeat protein
MSSSDSSPRPARLLRGALLGACVLLLCACAAPSARPAPGPATPGASAPAAGTGSTPAAVIERLSQQVEQGRELVRDKQFAQADTLLATVIAAGGFRALPLASQHLALQLDALAALQMRDAQRSLALLRRACDTRETDPFDWYLRVLAGNAAADARETVQALTTLAVRWPEALPRLEPYDELDWAMRFLQKTGSDADRYTVLSALYGVRLSEEHDAESEWWRDLALLHLARGERDAALGAILRITDAYVAISVEADRRFDPLRSPDRDWLSVSETAERAIAVASRRLQDKPSELEPTWHLARQLRASLRFQQELQVTDAAIERQESQGLQPYSDYTRWYVWILNARADALYGLGRWDAALTQLQAASERPEEGTANVSQMINLALMYAELGKPAESLATLKRVQSRRASPYGDMQEQMVTVFAALQLHDTKAADEALGFMRQHRDDAPDALEEALLVSGHDQECAQLLISRLADPRLRSDALLAVQQYDAGIQPPWLVEKQRRWQSLLARRDVQAAIAQVGRVSHYPLCGPAY